MEEIKRKDLKKLLEQELAAEMEAFAKTTPGSKEQMLSASAISDLMDALTALKKQRAEAIRDIAQVATTAVLGVLGLSMQGWFLGRGFQFEETGHFTSDSMSILARHIFNKRP